MIATSCPQESWDQYVTQSSSEWLDFCLANPGSLLEAQIDYARVNRLYGFNPENRIGGTNWNQSSAAWRCISTGGSGWKGPTRS